ncbi:MAG: efflux RND transporter periplasmic adaptor subunit [Rubripirellula sp.]
MTDPICEPLNDEPLVPSPNQNDSNVRSLMINVVIPSLLLLAAFAVVFFLGSVKPEQRPAADNTRAGRLRELPPVRVERLRTLESTGQQLRLQVDGTVVPFREAKVAAEVAGRVVFKAAECEAGSYVRKDQLLMRIDPTDYEVEVQRLTRQRDQEYQSLGEIDQEMVNSQRSIDVAKQDVALQQKEVSRLKSLPSGFSSPAEIDQANRAMLSSQQQLITQENQLSLLKKRRVRLESAEQLAATQLRAAQINLERTEIRAPIEGVIVAEDADLNTFVNRGSTLVTIDDTSKVEVTTNLRMDQLYWILDQQGKKVDEMSRGYDLPETPAIIEYKLSGRDDAVYRWRGRLLSYDGIGLDPVTRTVPVRVRVDNPREYTDENGDVKQVRSASALVRGMFVHIQLLIKPTTPLVVIPARALQPGNRVFQFVPDESVLTVAKTEPDNPSPSPPASTPVATTNAESDGPKFDASQWEPGRVHLRQSIQPVDSLKLSQPNTLLQASEFDGINRMWVCEVRNESLTGGSFVVTSPLGGVDDEPMPVRADRTGYEETKTEATVEAASDRSRNPDSVNGEEA